MFAAAEVGGVGAGAFDGGAAEFLAGGPERGGGVGLVDPDEAVAVGGKRGGVRQDDEGRLQALGAVGGHDAHRGPGAPGLALHLGAGAAEPVDEALEAGGVEGGVGEGGVEEFVDGFGGFGAEAGEEAGTAAEGAEGFGEEGVGGGVVGAFGQARKEGPGVMPVGAFMGAVAEGGPEGGAAVHGQRHQAVVGDVAEGGGEGGGDGEVVVREEDGVGGGQDVLDGDLFGELEAVEAGDGDLLGLEGADEGVGEGAAAADEDEDVAGFEQAVLGQEGGLGGEFAGDGGGDGFGEALGGGDEALVGLGDGPGLLGRVFGGWRKRPKLDLPGVVGTVGEVLEGGALRHALAGDLVAEGGVHQREDGGGRAEGDVERDVAPGLPAVGDAGGHLVAGAGELGGVGALERVDGLLGVADGEEGAGGGGVPCPAGFGRVAGEELLGEAVGDAPLFGGGVLDLVEEEVVDAAVELVEDPCGAGVLEQAFGAEDEVAVVEEAGAVLLGGVGGEGWGGEAQEGDGGVGAAEGAAGVLDAPHALLFLGDGFADVGVPVMEAVGRVLAEGGWLTGAGLVEEVGAPGVPVGGALGGGEGKPGQHAERLLADAGGAVGLGLAERLPERFGAGPGHRLGQDGFVVGGGDVGGLADAVVAGGLRQGEEGGEAGTFVLQGADEVGEVIGADEAGEEGDGGGVGVFEDGVAGGAHLGFGLGVLDELEVGGEGGLEGEAAEEGLAEGVDGADAHAAGKVEDGGEEGPGVGAGGGGPGNFEGLELGVEERVVEGDPVAEAVLEAEGHLGGGGLGEGEALDAGRGGSAEHEAEHAVGEELGLAGAGGGFDEGGDLGVGGLGLFVDGALAGGHRGVRAWGVRGVVPGLGVVVRALGACRCGAAWVAGTSPANMVGGCWSLSARVRMGCGVGGLCGLGGVDGRGGGGSVGHWSSSAADHSATRARWA